MKYLMKCEEYIDGSYPGPPIVNQIRGIMVASGSDGIATGGPGSTGAMGGEFPKEPGPNSGEFPKKYKPTVKTPINIGKNKKLKKKLNLLNKVKKDSILSFDEFSKKEK